MPRVARIVVAGTADHVTQRGNNKQDVFFVDDDRRVYLELLREQDQRFGFRIEGYCLMANHVHVVGVPAREESLAKAIGRTHFLYSQYVSRMHGRSWHLWQDRFYSCAMDDGHAHNALARAALALHFIDYSRLEAEFEYCSKERDRPLTAEQKGHLESMGLKPE